MYLWQYVATSVVLTTAVTAKALALYPNFYSAMLSIGGNSTSLCVILNQGLCIMWLVGKVLMSAIFGELRLAEVEYIYQRVWFLSIECVIMVSNLSATSNALDLGLIIAMVGFLLVFHWVLHERTKVFFQMLTIPTKLQFLKIFFFNAALIYLDVCLCLFGCRELLRGNKLIVLIVSEFFDLLQISISSIFQLGTDFYEFYVADLEEEDEWDPKEKVMFSVKIVLECTTFIMYGIIYYALGTRSIHLIIGLADKARKIYALCGDFYRFFTAKSSLESWVSDPTLEDLSRDNTCVICREEMTLQSTSERLKPRKMQCGHIIHFACLKSWLGRSQNCPTCRQPVKTAKSAFIPDRERTPPPSQTVAPVDPNTIHTPQNNLEYRPLSRSQSPQSPVDTTNWVKYPTRESAGEQKIKLGDKWYEFSIS